MWVMRSVDFEARSKKVFNISGSSMLHQLQLQVFQVKHQERLKLHLVGHSTTQTLLQQT
jgi:hypothetical protein